MHRIKLCLKGIAGGSVERSQKRVSLHSLQQCRLGESYCRPQEGERQFQEEERVFPEDDRGATAATETVCSDCAFTLTGTRSGRPEGFLSCFD
jgi:hypothetical protein